MAPAMATDFTPLDRAAWNALNTVHEPLAIVRGLARRYPRDVSPFAALAEPSAQAFADLHGLFNADESVALPGGATSDLPDNWKVMRSFALEQMVCTERFDFEKIPDPIGASAIVELTAADVPDMLALTAATKPGPFLPRTIRMGRYYGIRAEDGRLAAMAGERLRLPGFIEISAVCTDPQFRGRGYAGALMAKLMDQLFAAKQVPFLHVVPQNEAKVLYAKLGFRVRATMQLTVISPG
jgi:predicted GNAT family acetyltransferase